MLNRLRQAYGRWRLFRQFDSFVCAYPKTGNTWSRMFLGRYAQALWQLKELPLFEEAGIKDAPSALPNILFTHAPLEWHDQTAAHLGAGSVVRPFTRGRVVVLVRHPLDTLLSSYMQLKTREKHYDFAGGFGEFVRDPVWGLEKFLRYYELWAEGQGQPRAFLLQRYEDARADPAGAFRQLLDFLGLPFDQPAFDEALGYSDFSNMQKLEKEGRGPVYRSSGASIFATASEAGADGMHVRQGKVGGYVEHLTSEQCRSLEDEISQRMPALYGYR